MALALALAALVIASAAGEAHGQLGVVGGDELKSLNVYGEPLAKCDRSKAVEPNPGLQTTGFNRDNLCMADHEDTGSHYVCADLPNGTTSSGKTYSPFWTVTKQAQSPEEASTSRWPKPGPWCICMWAYASMRVEHPDFKNMIDCPATHAWVVDSYSVDDPKQRAALESVCERCDVVGKGKNQQLVDKCKSVVNKASS